MKQLQDFSLRAHKNLKSRFQSFFLSFELVKNSKAVSSILLTIRAREKIVKGFKDEFFIFMLVLNMKLIPSVFTSWPCLLNL